MGSLDKWLPRLLFRGLIATLGHCTGEVGFFVCLCVCVCVNSLGTAAISPNAMKIISKPIQTRSA